jgi:hypothetical protein
LDAWKRAASERMLSKSPLEAAMATSMRLAPTEKLSPSLKSTMPSNCRSARSTACSTASMVLGSTEFIFDLRVRAQMPSPRSYTTPPSFSHTGPPLRAAA